MKDPYKVLGITPNASEQEIKEAYRSLAKKYHPDNYADSPLKDVAEEKMQEINEAYDNIMNQRRSSSGNSNAYNGNPYTSASSSQSDIRRLIQQNRLVEAEELLDGTPLNARDAEWYFLKGSIYYSRGWLDDAANHFATACRLNPNNMEYRAAMNRMQTQRSGAFASNPYRTTSTTGGCSACDMCQGLICADCCCECMGGDLISCC